MDTTKQDNAEAGTAMPAFLLDAGAGDIKVLDVRPSLASGNDPLQLILEHIKSLQDNEILKIINTFEPVPLIGLLKKQGYEFFTSYTDSGIVETYFHKANHVPEKTEEGRRQINDNDDWGQLLRQFEGKFEYIDVRDLEMPQPMLKIMDALEHLPSDKALYVHHKRIPVFLLDELKDRQFECCMNELSANEVHLVIFKR